MLSELDFGCYWKVEGGIKGENGALIELRYARSPQRTSKNLDRLEELIASLSRLSSQSVLQSPKLIAQIWRMPLWVMGQEFASRNRGMEEQNLRRLMKISEQLTTEVQRLLGSPMAYPENEE